MRKASIVPAHRSSRPSSSQCSLVAREHRVQRQAGAGADERLVLAQAVAVGRGARVLPADHRAGARRRRSQTTADSRWLEIAIASGRRVEAGRDRRQHALPDLLGVLLDPARARDTRSRSARSRARRSRRRRRPARALVLDVPWSMASTVMPRPVRRSERAASAMPPAVRPKRRNSASTEPGRREHAGHAEQRASAPGARWPRPRPPRRRARRAPCAPRPSRSRRSRSPRRRPPRVSSGRTVGMLSTRAPMPARGEQRRRRRARARPSCRRR